MACFLVKSASICLLFRVDSPRAEHPIARQVQKYFFTFSDPRSTKAMVMLITVLCSLVSRLQEPVYAGLLFGEDCPSH